MKNRALGVGVGCLKNITVGETYNVTHIPSYYTYFNSIINLI